MFLCVILPIPFPTLIQSSAEVRTWLKIIRILRGNAIITLQGSILYKREWIFLYQSFRRSHSTKIGQRLSGKCVSALYYLTGKKEMMIKVRTEHIAMFYSSWKQEVGKKKKKEKERMREKYTRKINSDFAGCEVFEIASMINSKHITRWKRSVLFGSTQLNSTRVCWHTSYSAISKVQTLTTE